MCTLSFIPTKNKVFITSNRDEDVRRGLALEPAVYKINEKEILYPKDPLSGGTWFAVREQEAIMVLLNGAEEKHKRIPPYQKSRGIILLDLIGSEDSLKAWDNINLDRIEPFTIVFYNKQELYQWRWNGIIKTTTKLDPVKPYIWSSSTLYSKEIRMMREKWFFDFLENDFKDAESIIHFHKYGGSIDKQNGFQINRNQTLITQNITQAILTKQTIS